MKLTCEEVENIPDVLMRDVLYISAKYKTAIHLCACGCGEQVVTPTGEGGWTLTFNGSQHATLTPSIGNRFKCKSHYYIRDSEIIWA